MSERLTLQQTADLLLAQNDIGILMHRFPDGDTIGSAYALCRALRARGKRAKLLCCDPIPDKYSYLHPGEGADDFEPAWLCAVDVATPTLLGSLQEPYGHRIALCIDHHATNAEYADYLLLDDLAANAMNIARLIPLLGVEIDQQMAESLYTGIATDTGCFRFPNTTADTFRMAGDLVEYGVRSSMINRLMFETKSRALIELEREALDGIEFAFHDRVAVVTITRDMIESTGAGDDEIEGLIPLSRQIEGVWVGLTLRQKPSGNYKVSVRTGTEADASAICAVLGGGGHMRAAGCDPEGNREEVLHQLLTAIAEIVPEISY